MSKDNMRSIILGIRSVVARFFFGVLGVIVGLVVGGTATIIFYVLRILLSLEPYIGSKPEKIMDAILDTGSFDFWALIIGGLLGALYGFLEAFRAMAGRRIGLGHFPRINRHG